MSRKRLNKQTPPRTNKEYWEMIKDAFGENPKEVNAQFTHRTLFYKEVLENIIKGRFKVKCPEWWDVDYMLNLLIYKGRFFITNTSAGVAPVDGSSHGYNMFLRAPYLTVVNSVLGTFDRILFGRKRNAVCVYLYDNKGFRSMYDIINVYAQKLANVDASIDVNLMNTRAAYIFNAEDTKQADEAKLIYDKISRGEPAVYTRVRNPMNPENGGLEITTIPVKNNYIAGDLIEAKRAIISEFLTLVGLNSTSYEKKERLITAEVDSNNEESEYNIAYMKRNLKRQCKAVRDMFGIEFKIKVVDGHEKKKKKKIAQDLHQKTDS